MREAKPLAAAPDAAAKARARRRSPCCASIEARAVVFVDGALRAGTVRSRRPRAGAHASARWRGARVRRSAARGAIWAARADRRRRRSRSTPRSWATASVIRVADGAALARPIHLVFVTAGRAGVDLHPLAGRDRQGRARRRSSRATTAPTASTPGQCGARARGRRRALRSITSRSPARRRGRSHVSTLNA